MPFISVIIPVYNGAETIEPCLSSVRASSFRDFEVILVDDGSTDRTMERAERFGCRTLRLAANRGPGYARNRGVELAQGDILFFLDADITIEADTLSRVVQTFREKPEISAFFCSYQKDTPAESFFSKYKNLLHHYTHQISSEEAATFCAGYGGIKRRVFLEMGGFDEAQRQIEDIELGYRMYRHGHKIFLNKEIQLTHLKNYSLSSLVRSDVLGRAKPWTEIMLKRRIVKNDLNTRVENALSLVVAYLILAVVPVALVWPWVWIAFGPFIVLLLFLNRHFYAFIFREKGLVFLAKSILLNWFGYLYSGVGLWMGVMAYARDRLSAREEAQR